MADTRLPSLLAEASSSFSLKNVTAHSLTFYLNLKHACLHNASLFYFHLDSESCRHPLWGARHPSYCKLAAIADAVSRGFDRVVFLDSDAFIRDASVDIAALLRRYGGDTHAAAIEFGWDSPYSLGPNAGFASFRLTTARDRTHVVEALRLWWNLFAGSHGLGHPFEQHVLHWGLLHLQTQRHRLRTLPIRTMEPGSLDAVNHLDHNAGRKTRVWVMARAVAETLLSRGSPSKDAMAMAPTLRRWLPILQTARSDLKYAERLDAVHAVTLAARHDLSAMIGQPQCMPTVQKLNATDAAIKWLSWPPPSQRAGTRASSTQLGRVLSGLPLTLARCTMEKPFANWQTWRLLPDTAAEGNEGVTSSLVRLSLLAVPSLCLAIGVTRSPRNPYQTLATLEPCEATGEDGVDVKAVHARTRHSLVASEDEPHHKTKESEPYMRVRSALIQSALRPLLPELRSGCGFWPSCIGASAVLAKPCWAKLANNMSACGNSEPAIKNLVSRSRWGGLHSKKAADSVIVGPSGPVASAALSRGGSDALCLSTWRSQALEGQTAVFIRCPRGNSTGTPTKAHRGRWDSAKAVEWSQQRSTASGERRARHRRVSLRPRAAPDLCLTAPPLPW